MLRNSGDNVNRMSMVVWSVTHVFSFSVHIINGFILLQTHAVLIDILDILWEYLSRNKTNKSEQINKNQA